MLNSSRKKSSSGPKNPDLTSVMDAIFILLFYFITFLTFETYKEIATVAPQVDESAPKDDKKPLALNLKIDPQGVSVFLGVPAVLQKTFAKNADGKYDLENLHNYLIEIKKKNPLEKLCILEPDIEVSYEEIVSVMDTARILRKTDEAIYVKDQKGNDLKLEALFSEVVFANI
jgi:biopolymer transport protein ExbD